MALLSKDEAEQVSAAVARVEANTSGELAVVVAGRSDDYALGRGLVALLCTLPLVDLIGWQFPALGLTELLLGGLVVGAVIYWLAGTGVLLRRIIPERVRRARCYERALRAMMEQGVTDTRDRSGVLIFLSELEHRVVLLADRGIHERVSPSEWDDDVAQLTVALRAKRPVQGLLTAIERIGVLLAEHFPPRADDSNELPDAPRIL